MVENIIFFVISFALFMIIFYKMIRRNDTNYLYILILQAVGILIKFVHLLIRIRINILLLIVTYILSIIIPIIIILVEKKGLLFTEIIYLLLSKLYTKIGNEEKAKKMLQKLVEKVPESYYGHRELAKKYEKENNLELALDEYIRTINIHPDINLNYKVSYLLYKTGKADDSAEILYDILKNKPEFEEATLLLGDILYEQEKFKEAVNIYLNALKYSPYSYDLYYNLGMVYTRLNDFQSAKEYYEKAAQLNTLLFIAKFNLGQIALLYNELDEAEQYFLECVQDEDLEEDAYYCLGYIAMLRGDENKAVEYLNTAVDENPELYDIIKKEVIFKLIFNKVKKPKPNKVSTKPKAKITRKDKQTMKHLKKTYDVVGRLNNNDIKAMRTLMEKRQEEKER